MIFWSCRWRRIWLRNAARGCGLIKDLRDAGLLYVWAVETDQQIQQRRVSAGGCAGSRGTAFRGTDANGYLLYLSEISLDLWRVKEGPQRGWDDPIYHQEKQDVGKTPISLNTLLFISLLPCSLCCCLLVCWTRTGWCLRCVSPCRRTMVPQMLRSALWGTVWRRCFPWSILFHFTSLRDANLSNPKGFGKKFSFMEIWNSKHSCQITPLLLMIFCWEIWGIHLNLEVKWRKGKERTEIKILN